MSQTFTYSFTLQGIADQIFVTADDSTSTVTAPGSSGASGYAVTAISGSIGGSAITAMLGEPATYLLNDNMQIADDSVIFPAGSKDEYGQPTYDGLSNAGIAFETANGSVWNLYFFGSPNNPVFGLTQFAGGQDTTYTSGGATFSSIVFDPPCYCEGTRIATERGEIAVEHLAVGDVAVTASGARRPVVWIGRRVVECAAQRDPLEAWPIRIAAHAFADGAPRRDLWVSPGHNIAFAGALMRASALVNGVSVTQEARARVTYFHVELDAHDLLLAEGLPAESYLDQGNRAAFENGLRFLEAHPQEPPKRWDDTCLPIVAAGPALVAARRRLLERLAQKGVATTSEPALHILADGARIEPIPLRAGVFGFALPADRQDIRLCSRSFTPAEVMPESNDRRSLGVCIGALSLDGDDVDLAEDASFAEGWWSRETDAARAWRWTQGSARLPPKTRLVIVTLAGAGLYREAPCKPRLALVV